MLSILTVHSDSSGREQSQPVTVRSDLGRHYVALLGLLQGEMHMAVASTLEYQQTIQDGLCSCHIPVDLDNCSDWNDAMVVHI